MNDTLGNTSSSLAIAEKRPQRPGGCVGIFFQLFDWNRRLAKKKLFSKKLLPPDRAKRVSKKFSGDEKRPMAKLLLIADENRGGFPNAKKCEIDGIDAERNSEMRSPGLIARLMGLESMPTVRKEKPKKPSFSDNFLCDSEDKSVNGFQRTSQHLGFDQEDINADKGRSKLESRPQKLQKTGMFDRRPITRFGAEALQFKSVLSRSKKHHQKLASPVKSPRRLSARNAARLMEAATKILEPGLQATNRAKCALTYSSSLLVNPEDHITVEGTTALSLHHSKHYPCGAKSLKEQFPHNSCGNLLDVNELKSNVEEQRPGFLPLNSEFSNACQGSAITKRKGNPQSPEQERDVLRNQNQFMPTSPAKANMYIRRVNVTERKPPFQEDQVQRRVSNQQCRSQKDLPGQNQILVPKDRIPRRSKYTNVQSRKHMSAGDCANGTKNFVALNRNLSSPVQPRMHPKVLDNLKNNSTRYAYDKQDDSSLQLKTPHRKRRPANFRGQVESTGIHNSSYGKQRTISGNVNERKRMDLNACFVNQNHIKSEHPILDEGNKNVGDKGTNIVSFMFSSPVRHRTASSSPPDVKENYRGQNEFMGKGTSQKKQLFGANDENTSHKAVRLSGDALGALLEQKLRELTFQEGDGLSISEKSTASILEELISALTAERTVSHDEENSVGGFHQNSLCNINSDLSDHVSSHGEMLNSKRNFQTEAKAVTVSVGLPLSGDGEHPSPLSVLEASFSTDTCLSDSLDGGSGCKMQPEPMDCFYDLHQTSGADADLLDSATSFSQGSVGREVVTNSFCSISKLLDSIGLAEIGLDGDKLNHAREVLLNAELLFGNASPSVGKEDFVLGPIFLSELEILFDALSRSSDCRLGFMQAKEGNQLRKFLFDCMIECLDLKYGHCCKMGFKSWKNLRSGMRRESLGRKVNEEIRIWTDLAGRNTDEIIDREMSDSSGKWMHFEVEAFETGAEIEQYILKLLINEMVIDLLPHRGSSI
ncbi:uncharacterized protein LOC122652693 isoform X2 [Telopea speciosissima]|uniref:uncharacterized protein LOC122652693 isoform X2 n=1 Tax=Telopea speciosissima TaxID=54955 RepID=UPI001CC6D98D|nr:uncharacterized protein LOC122652693 isoform X2 [Telopea speciosissima]